MLQDGFSAVPSQTQSQKVLFFHASSFIYSAIGPPHIFRGGKSPLQESQPKLSLPKLGKDVFSKPQHFHKVTISGQDHREIGLKAPLAGNKDAHR